MMTHPEQRKNDLYCASQGARSKYQDEAHVHDLAFFCSGSKNNVDDDSVMQMYLVHAEALRMLNDMT